MNIERSDIVLISRESLEKEAEALFSEETLEELKMWYVQTLDERYQYVTFIVRRSYLLALIMERITGKKMKDSTSTTFLTDSALFLHCEEFAEVYRKKGSFPYILLCDDILIHGRNINHYIECLEEQLCLLLPEYEEQEIRRALVQAIWIHVYIRSDEPLLLLPRYELNYDCAHKREPFIWHKLSSDISSMILRSNMANAAYIFSEYISEDVFKKLDLTDFIKTRYQNTFQYTKVSFVKRYNDIKAILTIRLIKNVNQNGYRIIPFVFLPNLSDEETKLLKKQVLLQMDSTIFEQKDKEFIYYLEGLRGKRTFNELITLIFSQTLLQEFNLTNNIIRIEEDFEEEIVKLSRNYNMYGFLETREFLQKIIRNSIFTTDELVDMLDVAISDDRKICTIYQGKNVDSKRKNRIKIKLENYFYEEAKKEERAAFELRNQPFKMLVQSSERRVRGCGFTLTDLLNEYGEEEIKYNMAYFLQMMDAGILSVSSFSSNRIRVVGFSQFAKAGEQSLLIYPLRVNEYMPMLEEMQRHSEQSGKELQQEIIMYFNSLECDIVEEEKIRVLNFVATIESIGEKPIDWKENYLTKMQFETEEPWEELSELIAYMDKQYDHLERYREYIKNQY